MATQAAPVRVRTGMALTSLILALVSLCTAAGFLVGGLTACVLGIVALVKASRSPQEYGGTGMAIAGIVISALSLLSLPIVAAIAIPSLLRARISANESAAIGDLRTMISGQAAYQNANGGLYDTPRCLAEPSGCIPGYSASGPTFLDSHLASLGMKSGYVRTFHPGPPADQLDPAVSSRTSILGYVFVAVPADVGRTGVRAFCADHTGMICYTVSGSEPLPVDGACPPPPSCTPIS
jgi:type IV pilus assembly protein PilA